MTDEPPPFPPLRPCEEVVTDGTEWYFRQVRPQWVDEDVVAVDAFTPTSSDDRMLSGARSSKQTAEGAYTEFQRDYPERGTVGTWGFTIADVSEAKGRVVDDAECPPPPNQSGWPTGHAYLDQRTTARKSMRLKLTGKATRNGRLYPPPDEF